MTSPISIIRDGHTTWFKWHRGRRRASDPVFTGTRLLEAMALGASTEVDLVVTADRGFAVLHDMTLDRETTGSGPVVATSDAIIRQLRLRANDGTPLTEPVMLLEDLCAVMASGTVHPDALLQLDYKEDLAALDDRTVERFRTSVEPVARNIILSSGDAAAVDRLHAAVPAMRVGFDPSDEVTVTAARTNRTHADFVAAALAASPRADLIYLYWEIVLWFADDGFDICAAFHAAGKRVDAWTIQTVDATSVAAVNRLLALKVDQITTDDPEGLAAALDAQP
jgi:glycerophosphoryl diester phosphodiesterase